MIDMTEEEKEDWCVFATQLHTLGFKPAEWIDLFESFVEYKIKPLDFISSKRAAEKMSSLMVMQLTNLALFAKSEQVRSSSARELAYFGGLKPKGDDGLVNQTEEELDAQIRSYFGENEKFERRREEGTGKADKRENSIEEATVSALLQTIEGSSDEVHEQRVKDSNVLSGKPNRKNNNRRSNRSKTLSGDTPDEEDKDT